ncbi:hypothetical protein LTR20_000054 [Exophiala xenobiotica]|nr:hypothetical protein LTR40_007255 [Exophiala xenobiotica]KAK5368654.1 hypothetical protein LTS13_007388 [Exophiala xenobiotica]KAK5401521.1 hypothetical protein LTR79_002040 [Exophiala xenobiotica]KAK5425221.1 hypothetical protein LTR90_000813 [Exophiala xenobiotica]KAK5472596.1 hypothetical protein LTR20_000054 [Exophiala xenobiotica]
MNDNNSTSTSSSDTSTPTTPSAQAARGRKPTPNGRSPSTITIYHGFANQHTALVRSFVDKIKPSVGVKYNLAWTYGDYLNDIPARLGTNEALDAATSTFVATFQRFSNPEIADTHDVLEQYGLALASLRKCLSDTVKAKAPETLCAVLLLMNCQQFIWSPNGACSSHAEGAAQILRLRGRPGTNDSFERNLLQSLRAVVLFESLFSDRVSFTDREWIDMFDNKEYALSAEGRAVQCLTRLPNLMRRAKKVLLLQGIDQQSHFELAVLQHEAQRLRDELEPSLIDVQKRYEGVSSSTASLSKKHRRSELAGLIHCHYIRTYSIGLAIVIFVNELRIAVSTADRANVLQESHTFALEILDLAQMACQYRPVGASVMSLSLLAAEIGAADPSTAWAVRQLRMDYDTDFRDQTASAVTGYDWKLICGREDACLSSPGGIIQGSY